MWRESAAPGRADADQCLRRAGGVPCCSQAAGSPTVLEREAGPLSHLWCAIVVLTDGEDAGGAWLGRVRPLYSRPRARGRTDLRGRNGRSWPCGWFWPRGHLQVAPVRLLHKTALKSRTPSFFCPSDRVSAGSGTVRSALPCCRALPCPAAVLCCAVPCCRAVLVEGAGGRGGCRAAAVGGSLWGLVV
jgi:hypothetical protein